MVDDRDDGRRRFDPVERPPERGVTELVDQQRVGVERLDPWAWAASPSRSGNETTLTRSPAASRRSATSRSYRYPPERRSSAP
jgi:hypothetical protein